MDYDDNEFQGQNLQLAGEGCSKISAVLCSYPLPNFDFDDSIHGHFENEVFLGITNQEDSHWIEEYSRINNGIEFSSSAVESRRNNVWSEATSPESVEMLLKSVGQEENSAGEIKIENLDVGNDTCSLTKVMDPNSNQESEKVPTSVVEKHDLSVLEEKVGNTFDDAIQNEPENLSNELTNKEPPHVPRVEYLGSSSVDDLTVQENLQQVSVSASGLSENVSNVEKSLSFVPNIVENSSTDTSSIQVSDYPPQKSKSKDTDSRESNTGSLTIASAMKIIENESAIEKDESAIHVSQDVSFNEKENASLPLERSDIDIEVVRALDNQKNVEPFSLLEGSKENTMTAHNFQSDVSVQVEQVAFTESDNNETDDQPKSPIFGVSLVHQDNKEKTEVVFQSKNEIPQIGNVVNSSSKDSSSLVEKEDSHRVAEKKVHGSDFHNVTPVESCNASQIEQEPETNNGGPSDLSEVKAMNSQKESMIEVNKSNEHDSSLPSKITDDVEDKIQSVSLSNATHEEKSFTFDVNKSGGLGEAGKDIQSYPAFQASSSPKITDGPSTDYSISQLDAEKLHGISQSPQNPSGLVPQTKVKGKSERKPRRKSTGKENAKKTAPETGQVTRFEEVKSHENVERSSTKPGAALSSPKLPDLNNLTSVFQQPFTDNQQVQLRAQILVYGSLISGSPPEEAHMVAAFGQSDGARTWDSVWRACLERLHVQKAQSKSNNPIQAQPGSRADKGIKHASIQNKIPTSPVIGPMIPLSSPLWNMSTPSDNLQSSVMLRTGGHLDHHHSLSALHPTYQTPPVQNFSGHNPVSWLSQGPFSGQWATCFPALPITPVKESSSPVIKHSPKQTVHNSSFLSGMKATATPNLPSSDSKGRKRKKGIIPAVSAPCSSSVVVSVPSHDSKNGHQNMEKVVISEETLTKVEESKIQAVEATKYADNAARHCHNVWRQLETQYCSGLNPDNEAKLVSSAISLAAAASVAKVAAAAAKIASDVADQARSMVNAFSSSKSQNLDQSSMISLNRFDKATPDAIVKAAELAAEAVSQAGKIVAMSEPLPLKHLVEAGPEGYWKKNVETALQVSDKGIPTAKYGSSGKETSQDSGKNHTLEVDGISVSLTSQENDKRKPRVRKVPEFSNTIEVVPELEIGSIDTSGGQIEPEVPLKESNIKEGCLVEVYKDDDKPNAAWFGGNVLSLKDGKALVCYTDIQSEEGSGKLKEWVPLEVEGSGVPKIRVAHHPMGLEGTKKRRRTSATDFLWSTGDRVDVWMQDRWREAVVMETNKIDVTSLTVQFLGEGEASVVRSWFVRPTLFWKDGKWIDSHTSEKCLSSQGDTPQQKRLKLGNPVLESKTNDGYGSLESFDLVDSSKQKELRTLNLSTHDSVFSIGSTRDEKLNTHPTTRSGVQKESPRVIFGVPKPGKKQKFMDVSKHYVADKSNKLKTAHDSSVKFTKYLIPQAPGSRGWKMDSRSDTKEKQAAEIEPRIVKPRKPPIPASKTSKSTISRDHNKASPDSLNDGDQSGHQNPVDIGSSSNIQSAPDLASSLGIPKGDSTKSERSKKRKFAPMGGKPTKVEKSQPELAEPRRSNRKIQPTSRLLEGLQSSMTISKIPSAAHFTQKSYKVTPKGNTNNA